jgi:small subunit ribosomal protein S17
MATKKKTEEEIGGDVAETVETEAVPTEAVEAQAEAAAPAEEKPKRARKASTKSEKIEKKADEGDVTEKKKGGKRAERIGVVSSDKMTKTVVVRVDRLVKHPIYRKYVRKRKKFMAHDELGAKIGDKVKIVETRPLSARKRWRVVEIIQKAEL